MENNYDFKEIETLLKSEDVDDLRIAREKTRDILTEMTSKIFSIFLSRLELMGLIASSKRKSEAILQLDREYELISKFSEIAQQRGDDKNMVEMLIWLITAAGKEKQRQILGRDTVFVKEGIDRKILIENLLELTKRIALSYNEYGEGFNSTKLAKEFELGEINELISTISNKDTAIDLGCANGVTTRLLSSKGFKKVVGFDISPDMLKAAKNSSTSDVEEYIESNLFDGIPMQNNSVDLFVSNFGTASQIDVQFSEINRVLKKGGKAYLSFYNKDFINSNWWQPWQGSLEPIKNPEDDILEVPILGKEGNKSYKVFAKSLSSNDIEYMAENIGLKIESISNHSCISAIMPPMFFNDENRIKKVVEYEKMHAKQKPYLGFYLTVVLTK